jgi:hypothetical protein
MVVNESFLDRLARWFEHGRRKTVRKGALFHELDEWHVPNEAIDEVAKKVRKKTRGDRDE